MDVTPHVNVKWTAGAAALGPHPRPPQTTPALAVLCCELSKVSGGLATLAKLMVLLGIFFLPMWLALAFRPSGGNFLGFHFQHNIIHDIHVKCRIMLADIPRGLTKPLTLIPTCPTSQPPSSSTALTAKGITLVEQVSLFISIRCTKMTKLFLHKWNSKMRKREMASLRIIEMKTIKSKLQSFFFCGRC